MSLRSPFERALTCAPVVPQLPVSACLATLDGSTRCLLPPDCDGRRCLKHVPQTTSSTLNTSIRALRKDRKRRDRVDPKMVVHGVMGCHWRRPATKGQVIACIYSSDRASASRLPFSGGTPMGTQSKCGLTPATEAVVSFGLILYHDCNSKSKAVFASVFGNQYQYQLLELSPITTPAAQALSATGISYLAATSGTRRNYHATRKVQSRTTGPFASSPQISERSWSSVIMQCAMPNPVHPCTRTL